MTFARASLVGLGLVGAFALGLMAGPNLAVSRDLGVVPIEAAAPAPAAAPVDPAAANAVRPPAPQLTLVPAASAQPVQKHVRLLLNRGTDVRQAAEGFPNALQLMTVAHAARNTEIPFLVLKHRVLTARKPLAVAISEFKPELDEVAEVNRARAEARADLAKLSL